MPENAIKEYILENGDAYNATIIAIESMGGSQTESFVKLTLKLDNAPAEIGDIHIKEKIPIVHIPQYQPQCKVNVKIDTQYPDEAVLCPN